MPYIHLKKTHLSRRKDIDTHRGKDKDYNLNSEDSDISNT